MKLALLILLAVTNAVTAFFLWEKSLEQILPTCPETTSGERLRAINVRNGSVLCFYINAPFDSKRVRRGSLRPEKRTGA